MEKTKEIDIKTMRRSKKYKAIRADLVGQLESSGATKEFYMDLVEDYMKLYETKTMLQNDIAERGVRVIYNNGGGQCGLKKNDSVELLLKVNTQMLKMLEALKISPTDVNDPDDDEL